MKTIVNRHRAGLLLAVLLSCNVFADDRFDAVIDRIGDLLAQHYVDAKAGVQLASELRAAYQDGQFSTARTPAEFASLLSDFLQPHDRHFSVDYADESASMAMEDDSEAGDGEPWHIVSGRHNFGFNRVEIRQGNVGYLELTYFDSPAVAGDTAIAAMNFLANAEALIIDLRNNGGGDPAMVQLLTSYLYPEGSSVHLNQLYWRSEDATHQFWTLPYVPGKRLAGVPVYVLVSGASASAAEEFVYNLRALDRARLIGATTYGGANPGGQFDAGNGFSIFISTGKAINPITGGNWEATGVPPHRETKPSEAENIAYIEALEALAAIDGSESRARAIAWALERTRYASAPVVLDRGAMRAYVGAYGNRHVRFGDKGLSYERDGREARSLLPLGNDRFMIDGLPDYRVAFERDASDTVTRMLVEVASGGSEAFARN